MFTFFLTSCLYMLSFILDFRNFSWFKIKDLFKKEVRKMIEKNQTVKTKTEDLGTKAIAGALERLNCQDDQFSDHTQGNYGAWDNA